MIFIYYIAICYKYVQILSDITSKYCTLVLFSFADVYVRNALVMRAGSINRVSVAKFVRMYIDENLKWHVHIDKIIPKISVKISILRSLRKLVPIDTLTLMYNAIVLPHFDYADIDLDSASAASKFKLQSLQTRAARLALVPEQVEIPCTRVSAGHHSKIWMGFSQVCDGVQMLQ